MRSPTRRRKQSMRGPKPDRLTLSERERSEMEALVRRHGTAQQLALRGRIILAAAQGRNNSQIARELGICVDTVRLWRTRWIGLQAASLDRSEEHTSELQ